MEDRAGLNVGSVDDGNVINQAYDRSDFPVDVQNLKPARAEKDIRSDIESAEQLSWNQQAQFH